MHRRIFLKSAIIIPAFSLGCSPLLMSTDLRKNRVRPGDSLWPSTADWESLKNQVGGRLLRLDPPFEQCAASGNCETLLKGLKNPYFIGDNPALTQTMGWVDAWKSEPSLYAVAAENSTDVVDAVNFGRRHNLRLVVKGGGHSYQGTSNSRDSLLIWPRAMNKVEVHDAFILKGDTSEKKYDAVTIGAGTIWMHAYNTVTTQHNKYVQGGGCATVGVAGLIQSGGFGSFSKGFGMAAAALLQAEVVTADGSILTVNQFNHPDLFWALKGGGGGTFGAVTSLTLKLRDLPALAGVVMGKIKANSDASFLQMIRQFMQHYRSNLFNPTWGEQMRLHGDNTMEIRMLFHGLDQQQADAVWKPFVEFVNSSRDYTWQKPLNTIVLPAKHLWDPAFFRANAPQHIGTDDRPGASPDNIFWIGDGEEAGQFLHAYHSAWMPQQLLDKNENLAKALFASSRHWTVALHFNKGLAGASADDIEAAKNTAMNPQVVNAFALAIIAGQSGPFIPGLKGQEPNLTEARNAAKRIDAAMDELMKVAPNAGSYVSESSYFLKNWQEAFWGENYPRLQQVKKKYDPDGLFFVRHGVGSEEWSDDGFTRKA